MWTSNVRIIIITRIAIASNNKCHPRIFSMTAACSSSQNSQHINFRWNQTTLKNRLILAAILGGHFEIRSNFFLLNFVLQCCLTFIPSFVEIHPVVSEIQHWPVFFFWRPFWKSQPSWKSEKLISGTSDDALSGCQVSSNLVH